jgi:hypothetical protein
VAAVTVGILVVLMLSGPFALFLTIRHFAELASSTRAQKYVISFWITFFGASIGLALFLANVSSAVETLVGVIGAIALLQFVLHRINLKPS